MTLEEVYAMRNLCPGSMYTFSTRFTGPGRYECPYCKRFVPTKNGVAQTHQREFDRHEPFTNDGVTYCGWAGEIGVIDGCGELWPCRHALRGEL